MLSTSRSSQRNLALVISAISTLAVTLGLPLRGEEAAAAAPEPEFIVYTTLQPYNLEIYLREAPDESWRRLTTDQANDYNAVFSPDGRWVVFCSERQGNPDLFALDLEEGGPPRPLTTSRTMEDAPAFSPDGKRLAFVSDRHGNADVFVMPFAPDDSTGDRRAVNLTSHPGGDFNPAFSPDGRWIAFSSERPLHAGDPDYWRLMELGGSDIYLMSSDGLDVRRLTRTAGWDGSPTFSADGEHVYFYSSRDGSRRIWRMGIDGSDQRPVSPAELDGAVSPAAASSGRIAFAAHGKLYSVPADGGEALDESGGESPLEAPAFDRAGERLLAHGDGPVEGRILRPDGRTFGASGTSQAVKLVDRTVRLQGIYGSFPAFGPGGERIVSSQVIPGEYGRRALVVSGADGSDPSTIHQTEGQLFFISWSPDGEWIVFSEGVIFGTEGMRVDLWRIRPDGSDLGNLTDSSWNDGLPDVTADGRIVFRSGRDGNKEIYMMAAKGGELRRLTHHPGIDTMPAISPDGSWLVYASDLNSPPGVGLLDLMLLQLSSTGEPGSAMPGWLQGLGQMTAHPGPDVHPKFSPDGLWVVYASARGGLNDELPLVNDPQPYGELWAQPMFPFGPPSPPVRLTHNKWEDSLADWAAPGKAVEAPARDGAD